MDFFPAEKLADYRRFELDRNGEKGFFVACLDHLTHDWQVDRGQQKSRPVIDECRLAKVDALTALSNHNQARRVSS